ncbi:unnamed protein product [Mytilus coruscus]|uniref:Uncharacterized protein n=1 Tax=Mytilus coruscus TaxID=42192 RepID=A0A6J8AJZ3_MYTCO|nr:unnamed protein product [Mytilus coruscus]
MVVLAAFSPREESTVHLSTTTGLILVKSTQDIYTQQSTTTRKRTLELVNMTTERTTQTSANLPTKISTFFAKEESVTQSGTMSKSTKIEDYPDDLNCCIFYEDINQHIYDEAGIYSKTNLPTARQACVSGYQELNFCIDLTKEQNVQDSDNEINQKDSTTDSSYH